MDLLLHLHIDAGVGCRYLFPCNSVLCVRQCDITWTCPPNMKFFFILNDAGYWSKSGEGYYNTSFPYI